MKRKIIALCMALLLTAVFTACGEEKETTLSGMVVSVDGTVISIMEMDTANMREMDFSKGERPDMSEGMGDFQGFGQFDPDDFEGNFPEEGNFPQWGNGEMPEDFTMPEDGSIPNFGEGMPNFAGNGGIGADFENFASDVETKNVDIGNAHISVEIDGGKASGSMDDIKAGTFVTITLNGKGEATYVLVSGGGRRPAN